jgi:DnaJ-class molecular chaperone
MQTLKRGVKVKEDTPGMSNQNQTWGKEIQKLFGISKGNYIVHLRVEIPKKITKQQEKLLQEFDDKTQSRWKLILGRIAKAAKSAFETIFGEKDDKKKNKSKMKEESKEEKEEDVEEARSRQHHSSYRMTWAHINCGAAHYLLVVLELDCCVVWNCSAFCQATVALTK